MPHADDRIAVAAGTPRRTRDRVGGRRRDARRPTTWPGARRSPHAVRSGPNELEAVPRATVLGTIAVPSAEPFVLLLFVAGVWRSFSAKCATASSCSPGSCRSWAPMSSSATALQRALASLRDATAPRALVRRAGSATDVLAADIVPERRRAVTDGRYRACGCPGQPRGRTPGRPECPDRGIRARARHVEPDEVVAVVADRRRSSTRARPSSVDGGRMRRRDRRRDRARPDRARTLPHGTPSLAPATRAGPHSAHPPRRGGRSDAVTVGLDFLRGNPAGANLAGMSPRRSPRSRRSPRCSWRSSSGWARIGCCGAASSCAD